VVATPASATRRALSVTWRLTKVLLVSTPASASQRCTESGTWQRGHSVLLHRDVHKKPRSTYGHNMRLANAMQLSQIMRVTKECFEIRLPLPNRSCQSIQLIRYIMQQQHFMQLIPVIGAIPTRYIWNDFPNESHQFRMAIRMHPIGSF
jgi:hypothetical protein